LPVLKNTKRPLVVSILSAISINSVSAECLNRNNSNSDRSIAVIDEISSLTRHNCSSFVSANELELRHSENNEDNEAIQKHVSKLTASIDKQTPLWAQEYIGADLVREEIGALNLEPSRIAILDDGFTGLRKDQIHIPPNASYPDDWKDGNHGFHTSSLTSSNSIVSSSSAGSIKKYIQISEPDEYNFAVELFEKTEYPNIINNSMIFWTDPESHQAIQKIASNNTTMLVSAGNYYPANHQVSESIADRVISVGWVDEKGLYHTSSTDGLQVDLVAPSGLTMLSKGVNQGYSFFSGSSGSTPLTSGAAADIAAVLGQSSIDIIAPILKNSALQYPLKNTKNGAGLLNSYKAFHVAKIIKEKCEDSKDCILKEVSDLDNYKFTSNQEKVRAAKNRILSEIPSCRENKPAIYKMKDCSLKESINELRKDFLLVRSKESSEVLSCLYQSLGLDHNSHFYDFYSKDKLDSKDINKMSTQDFFRHLDYLPQDLINESIVLRVRSIAKSMKDMVPYQLKIALDLFFHSMKKAKLTPLLKTELERIIKIYPNIEEREGEYYLLDGFFSDGEIPRYLIKRLLEEKKLEESQNLYPILCFEKYVSGKSDNLETAKRVGYQVIEHFFNKKECLRILINNNIGK